MSSAIPQKIPVILYGDILDGHRCLVNAQPDGGLDVYLFEYRIDNTVTRLAYRWGNKSEKKGRWILNFDCVVSRQKITA